MEATAAKPYATSHPMAVWSLLSVLAPILGLAVEMTLAWRYGVSATVDAYRISTLLIVVGSQLFFSKLLPHVLVPLFTECRAKDCEQEGWRLAFTLAVILGSASLVFIGWVWLKPVQLVSLLGPGLSAPGWGDAEFMLRYFSLTLLLMAWSGVASGVLQVYRVFWLEPVAQLMPNLFVVMSMLLAGCGAPVESLAFGLLLGYGVMLGLFALGLSRIQRNVNISLMECLRFAGVERVKKAMRLAAPLLLGILIGQWGIVVINRVMSGMPSGALSELGYAWKLLALVGLLPAGLAKVVFPAFSEANATGNTGEFSRLAERALRMTLFLTIPLAVVLYVEHGPLVGLLFGRGGMSSAGQEEIGMLFGILLVGAPAGTLGVALNKLAYSRHDMKAPTAATLFSALVITVLAPFSARALGVAGVAWTVSAAAWGGVLLLLWHQVFRPRVVPANAILRYLGRLTVLCVVAAMPVWALHAVFEQSLLQDTGVVTMELALSGILFSATFCGLSNMFGVSEMAEIGRFLKWQLNRLMFLKASNRQAAQGEE